MALTKKRQKIIDAARKAAERGEWTAITSDTIRWKRTMPTPDWAQRERPTPSGTLRALWPDDTFIQLVFLHFIGFHGKNPKIIRRVCRAPWVECQDTEISQREALEIIETPEAEFSG